MLQTTGGRGDKSDLFWGGNQRGEKHPKMVLLRPALVWAHRGKNPWVSQSIGLSSGVADVLWAGVRNKGLTELVEQEAEEMYRYKTREDVTFAQGIILGFECPMSTHPLLCWGHFAVSWITGQRLTGMDVHICIFFISVLEYWAE